MNGIIKSKSDKKQQKEKTIGDSKFGRILHIIFVHNIWYKLIAIGTSVLCWFLAVWLN